MANTAFNPSDKAAGIALSGGNLTATSSGPNAWVRAIDKQISGKFYWELTLTTFNQIASAVGIASGTANLASGFAGGDVNTAGVGRNGVLMVGGVSTGLNFGTLTSGTVVCIAIDASARLIWVRVGAAGNWNTSAPANPATGTGGVSVGLGVGIPIFPAVFAGQSLEVITANFGDTAFTGTVPSGFTSGFTAGVTTSTNALATQVATEHWLTTNPDAQVTQIAVEHWATVANAIPSTQGQRVMVLA